MHVQYIKKVKSAYEPNAPSSQTGAYTGFSSIANGDISIPSSMGC